MWRKARRNLCLCFEHRRKDVAAFGYAASLAQRDGSELVQPGDLGSLQEEH
jgi:hypothetical protein